LLVCGELFGKEATMDMSRLSDRERLAAEQAVLTMRALDRAADAAPEGQGLAYLERCIADDGFKLLGAMLGGAANARDEAQKKGSASGGVPAAGARSSRRASRATS
jgi:hypothetical protein